MSAVTSDPEARLALGKPAAATERHGVPKHVAVIMDGNGRAATRSGRKRSDGHDLGVEAARGIVRYAAKRGVSVLTLFAFSSQNWQRDPAEVAHLLRLFETFLREELDELIAQGIAFTLLGERSLLPESLQHAVDQAEARTRDGHTMRLVLAISYGGLEEVRSHWGKLKSMDDLPSLQFGPVDLLIRTGGEQRISNFVLLALAYSELYFSRQMWPDFTPRDFQRALAAFAKRQRRFGRVPPIATDGVSA